MTTDQTEPRHDGHAAEPLALRLNDQLGQAAARTAFGRRWLDDATVDALEAAESVQDECFLAWTAAMSQRRQVVLAAQALLALDLENDGATCEWPELLRAVADIRAAIAGQEPNVELTGPRDHAG